MIRLEHPQHGIKYADLEAEAEADVLNGWVRDGEPRPVVAIDRVDYSEPQLTKPIYHEFHKSQFKRGPGRPRKNR